MFTFMLETSVLECVKNLGIFRKRKHPPPRPICDFRFRKRNGSLSRYRPSEISRTAMLLKWWKCIDTTYLTNQKIHPLLQKCHTSLKMLKKKNEYVTANVINPSSPFPYQLLRPPSKKGQFGLFNLIKKPCY